MPRVIARLVGGAPWTEPLFPDSRPTVAGVQATVRDVASFELLVDTPQYHDPSYVLTGVAGTRLSLDGTTFGDVGADLPVAVSSTPRVVWIQVARGEVDAPTLVVPVGNCVLDEGDPKAGGVVASQSSIVGSVRRIVPVSGIVTSESAVVGAARKQTEYPLVEGTVFSSSALVGSVRRIVPVSGVVGMAAGVVGDATKSAPAFAWIGTHYLNVVSGQYLMQPAIGSEEWTAGEPHTAPGYIDVRFLVLNADGSTNRIVAGFGALPFRASHCVPASPETMQWAEHHYLKSWSDPAVGATEFFAMQIAPNGGATVALTFRFPQGQNPGAQANVEVILDVFWGVDVDDEWDTAVHGGIATRDSRVVIT